jgi:hypothetical protein
MFKEITEKHRKTEFIILTSKGITQLEFKMCCIQSHLFLLPTRYALLGLPGNQSLLFMLPTQYTLLGLADLLCEDNELSCMHITVWVADVQVRGFEVWTDDCTM